MGGLFTTLFSKIAAVVQWVADLFIAVFVALFDLIKDAAAWVFDQLLGIVVSALGAIDLGDVSTFSNLWASVPAGVLEIFAALGLGTAFGIIAAAIGIRLTLQLIPFTRLGS